ncbi:MAG: Arm DNA-binding domain-containing protein [Nostoc sp.]
MKVEHKVSKGSVGVESFQERLRLYLPRQLYNGKQKYLTLEMADNPENRKLVEAKAKQIESDYDTMPKDGIGRYLVQQSLNLQV